MGGRRFESLDGLRGVAALTIVILHWGERFGGGLQFSGASLSVDVFFVLSGFVIALTYEERLHEHLGIRGFLRARARRLLPVHFAAMLVVTAATFAGYAAGTLTFQTSLKGIAVLGVLNALFIPVFIGSGAFYLLNPPLWSLFDEWVVNFIYGAWLHRVSTRAIIRGGAFSFAFTGALMLHAGMPVAALPYSILRALGGFAAGVVIYRLYAGKKLVFLPSVRPEAVYTVWVVTCVVAQSSVAAQLFVTVAIAPLAVAVLVNGDRAMGKTWNLLGRFSYPLYASHWGALLLVSTIMHVSGVNAGTYYGFLVAMLFAQGGAWVVESFAAAPAVVARRLKPLASQIYSP